MVIEKGKWVVMSKKDWYNLKDENAALKKENESLKATLSQKEKQLASLWRAAIEAKKQLRLAKCGMKEKKE